MSYTINRAVANDILCYLETARHSIARDNIIINCISFYKDEAIVQAKEAIFKICGEKMIIRKSCASNRNPSIPNTQDILALLERKYSPGNVLPKFFATGYSAFPPNGFEYVAPILGSLKDEFVAVKEEFTELKKDATRDIKTLNDLECVKQDIFEIKNMLTATKQCVADSTGIQKDLVRELSEIKTMEPPVAMQDVINTACDIKNHIAELFKVKSDSTCINIDSYADKVKTVRSKFENQPLSKSSSSSRTVSSAVKQASSNLSNKRPMTQSDDSSSSDTPLDVRDNRPKFRPHNEWNIVGVRNHSGRGLAPAKRRNLDLFVGGCSVDASEEEVKDHCKDLGIEIKAIETLTTKVNWYKPFKITVEAEDREKLLKPDAWAKGIFVRKFFKPREKKNED